MLRTRPPSSILTPVHTRPHPVSLPSIFHPHPCPHPSTPHLAPLLLPSSPPSTPVHTPSRSPPSSILTPVHTRPHPVSLPPSSILTRVHTRPHPVSLPPSSITHPSHPSRITPIPYHTHPVSHPSRITPIPLHHHTSRPHQGPVNPRSTPPSSRLNENPSIGDAFGKKTEVIIPKNHGDNPENKPSPQTWICSTPGNKPAIIPRSWFMWENKPVTCKTNPGVFCILILTAICIQKCIQFVRGCLQKSLKCQQF